MYLIFTWTDGARISISCADQDDALETMRRAMAANVEQMSGSTHHIGKNADRLICEIPRASSVPLTLPGCFDMRLVG